MSKKTVQKKEKSDFELFFQACKEALQKPSPKQRRAVIRKNALAFTLGIMGEES